MVGSFILTVLTNKIGLTPHIQENYSSTLECLTGGLENS